MKHLTSLGQMWPKYLPLPTFTYNTFNTPNLATCSPYELIFSRKPKLLLNLEIMPDIKESGMFKDYYNLLNKRLHIYIIKYVGSVVKCKIIDPHNYLLMMLYGKILRGLFEHERLKPAIVRTNHRNVHNVVQLKQIINAGFKV